MKVRRGLTGSAALVMVLALAACEDSPKAGTVDTPTATESSEPETTEPETTEPEPTEEPTEPVPVLEEVPGEDPEITFAKHFYDVYNYAIRTGDVEPFLALSTDDCRNCNNIGSWITDIYGAGGYIEGGEYELLREPELITTLNPPEVWLNFREAAKTIAESADATAIDRPACDLIVEEIALHEGGDSWLVGEITVRTPCE